MKIGFNDLCDLDIISNFSRLFYNITGLILDIEDVSGEHPKKHYTNIEENKFCRIIKSSNIGLKKCIEEGKINGVKAAKLSRPVIYECHAGLTDVSVPILIRGRHIASLATGQVLLTSPSAERFNKISENIKYSKDSIKKLKEAYYSTTVINKHIFHDYITLINLVISYIAEIEDKITFLGSRGKDKLFFDRVKTYIEDYSYKKIYLEDVAKICYISKFYFVRMFKKEFGMSFTQYVNNVRMIKAKKMLLNRSIISVCYEVGYRSMPHFYRLFKQFNNCTPKEYQKTLTNSKVNKNFRSKDKKNNP